MNNWFVITGGPCSGKTTTISILSKRGYEVTRESARNHFESEIKKGRTNEEIRSKPKNLQDDITRLQIELEETLPPSEVLFFDRAVPDAIAYYQFHGLEIPDNFLKHYKNSSYKKVFFLQRLPMIEDEIRVESDDEAERISDFILKSYNEIAAEIIKIPLMPREERVNFILSNI